MLQESTLSIEKTNMIKDIGYVFDSENLWII